uniref:Uncharacterized protein n=1 Tax=Ditylenchus dipsaci TaxID=166011 RepID=A0A915ESY2_9BILA
MSADIGSTRNNKHSFLLIMADLYDVKKSRPLSLAFDIIPLHARYTGVYIAECIQKRLETHGLSTSMVSYFITDQGSNMLFAVRTVAQEDEFTLQLQQEDALEDADEEEEEDRGIDIHYNSDQLVEEEGDDEERPQEDLFAKLRHIDCSAHRLQIFIKDVYEKKGSAVQTCKKPSYLDSQGINEVCFEEWEEADGILSRLTTQDLQQMRSAMTMLGPLMNFTIRLQEESSPTISLLLPGLNFRRKITPNELVKSLLQNIRTRFAEVWTSSLFEATNSLDYRTLPFILKEKTEAEIGKTSNEDVTAEYQTDAEEEVEEMIYSVSAPLHPGHSNQLPFPGNGNSRLL